MPRRPIRMMIVTTPLPLLLLLPLVLWCIHFVVGGEPHAAINKTRRDIDIALQADGAPLSGSLLGLVNAPISYQQYYYASSSSHPNKNSSSGNASSALRVINATARIVRVSQSEGDYTVRVDTAHIPTTARAVLTGACPAGPIPTPAPARSARGASGARPAAAPRSRAPRAPRIRSRARPPRRPACRASKAPTRPRPARRCAWRVRPAAT
jgi:hypothetical protein